MTRKDHTIMNSIPSHRKYTKRQNAKLISCLPHYCSPSMGGLQTVVIHVQSNID